MNNTLFEISLKNDKRIIPEVASFISNSAVKLGLSEKKANFLCFTIETALEYRVDAIDEKNPDIKVSVEDNGNHFKFSVTDLGSPYILTKNQQTILKRKLVDKYSFEQRGRKGQCFSFSYKHDAIAPIEHVAEAGEELLDTNFRFRRLKHTDEDVLEAVKCLYETYGYDYYHQHLYSVDSFKKYMSNGRYVPIIGENEHKQFMCYCALDENEWFLGVPEFSNLVTKPLARGQGLATAIFKEAEHIAETMDYAGIHVSAVAYHPYTQMMCNKLGYTPSAIEYAINPPGTGGYDKDRRLECVIGIKIFDKEKKHELYIDQACNKLISMVFDEEKLNYELHNETCENAGSGTVQDACDGADQAAAESTGSGAEESLLSYVVDTDTSNSFFKIDQCGKNFKDDMKAILEKEEIKEVDAITVNLNMNHPSAILGYRALRELGFIATGSIPGCKNGDFMLLQAFKVQPAYEKIVVEPNYKVLLDEVFKVNGIK